MHLSLIHSQRVDPNIACYDESTVFCLWPRNVPQPRSPFLFLGGAARLLIVTFEETLIRNCNGFSKIWLVLCVRFCVRLSNPA